MNLSAPKIHTRRYSSPLIGNIRQILTGLQGFEAMARELVQNADDAGAASMKFDITDDALIVSNSASFSTCETHDNECPWLLGTNPHSGTSRACDFHAISSVGSGNKYREKDLIGRFGIGFVSVYQITDNPTVSSGSVRLSLDPLVESADEIEITPERGTVFELPWCFDGDSDVRNALNASPVTIDDLKTLEAELVAVTEDCLLFLRNLTNLEICRRGKTLIKATRSQLENGLIRLSYGEWKTAEDWFVLRFDARDDAEPLRAKYPVIARLDRQTTGQVAFRAGEFEGRHGRFYAYLPTEQDAPIPCHINADFFPEQNRKRLVLQGAQHELPWNEMLVRNAAKTVAANLLQIRDALGGKRLWQVIDEAHQHRADGPFSVFWTEILKAARTNKVVSVGANDWEVPALCKLLPNGISEQERRALSTIGIRAVAPGISKYSEALRALGTQELSFAAFVSALEAWLGKETESGVADVETPDPDIELLEPLWKVADAFVAKVDVNQLGVKSALGRLKDIRFAPKASGGFSSIARLYGKHATLDADAVGEFFPALKFISPKFGSYPKLNGLVRDLTLKDLLNEIQDQILNEELAREFLGTDPKRTRRLYGLLSTCPLGNSDRELEKVKSVPFLVGGGGRILTPAVAVIPGGFDDPVGRFDTVDMNYFGDGARELLNERLKLSVMTFETYITDHLGGILRSGVSDEEYAGLITQLLSRPKLLGNDAIRAALENLPLARTMAGDLTCARNCYVRTDELVDILGDQPSLWLDASTIEPANLHLFQGFLADLGMQSAPSIQHVIDRIEDVVAEQPDETRREDVSRLFHFLFELFVDGRLAEDSGFEDEIEWLRETEWLPAAYRGELLTEAWYAPNELYQFFRSEGFDTQVPVLAIKRSQRHRVNRDFLDFLEMPPAPSTDIIVSHLEFLIENEQEPAETTYSILNDRLREDEDTAGIERLKEAKVVYSPRTKSFLSTNRIFWSRPPVPRYCHRAPEWMHRYKELFDRLGVRDEPVVGTYVDVLIELSERLGPTADTLSAEDAHIVGSCLRSLAQELRSDRTNAAPEVDRLEEHPFLPTKDGRLAFVDEIAILDSGWLAEPFHGSIDTFLTLPDPDHAEILDYFDIPSLTKVVSKKTTSLGDASVDESASALVTERAELLVWTLTDLSPSARDQVCRTLRQMKVVRTTTLEAQSVFSLKEGIEYTSEPQQEEVLFLPAESILYVLDTLGQEFWMKAFRSIFATLTVDAAGLDVSRLAMCAYQVISAADAAAAQRHLLDAGFSKPSELPTQDMQLEEDEGLGELQSCPDEGPEEDLSPESEDADETVAEQPDANLEEEESGNDEGSEEPPTESGSLSDAHIRADRGKASGESEDDGRSDATGSSDRAKETPSRDSQGTKAKASDPTVAKEKRKTSIRTQYMRSYVIPEGDPRITPEEGRGPSQQRRNEIDAAAVQAVVEWEEKSGFSPDVQPPNNPGFDVLSRPKAGGEPKYIEIKGLANAWTERGVKLSRTQMHFAKEKGDSYWLYVVENALDPRSRNVHAIHNPFEKSDEFWFDEGWRDIASEHSGDQRSLLTEGRMIQVDNWGVGEIIKVERQQYAIKLTIHFRDGRTKLLTYNATTFEVLED